MRKLFGRPRPANLALLAVAVNPIVFGICGLEVPQDRLPVGGPAAGPAQEVKATAATPTDYGDCGPGAVPELGLQGQVPKGEQDDGRSKVGARCNLRRIGQTDIRARGANFQLGWYKDCGYVSIVGSRETQEREPGTEELEGVGVVDASNPRRPSLVRIVRSPVGRSQHEALEVNQRRGLLVVTQGGLIARYIEVYDVSKDCRNPVYKGRFDAGSPIYHGMRVSDDGRTVYATDTFAASGAGQVLHIIDIADPTNPKLIMRWDPSREVPPQSFGIHDLEVSPDGNRAYLGSASYPSLLGVIAAGAPSNTGPSMVALDTSDIQSRKPNPDPKIVGQIHLPNIGHTVQRARIGGKPYMFVSGETPFAGSKNCPWAWGHILDMSDERKPREVGQLKLEVNEQKNCGLTGPDDAVYSIHYVGVDSETNTTKVFYTYYTGGVRVFDVRNPRRPKEIAYYHPSPEPATTLKPIPGNSGGDAQTPEWDSATSMVRYRGDGEIWVASIGSGFEVLELTPRRRGCVKVGRAARGKRMGDARLGRTRSRQRRLLKGKLLSRRRGIDRYCAEGGGSLRVGYPTNRLRRTHPRRSLIRRAGRKALILLTSNRRASVRGIHRGTRTRTLRRRLRGERRIRIGRSVWYVAPGRSSTRLVFKTRRGRVLQVGVASKRLSSGRRAARSLLSAWRL